MISGLVLKYLNGECFVIRRGYETTLHVSSSFCLTVPHGMYSIADMACWPWVSRFEWQEVDLNVFPNVKDWYLKIAARPAVQAGYSVPKFTTDVPMP